MSKKYDFSGWATRYNIHCSDGRTILPGAFDDCDGKTVPLVWNHQHDEPENVLGNAVLEHHDEGVKAYCTFNGTEAGKLAKEIVQHGDITALSIYANKLKQQAVSSTAANVIHGAIREVSLVLASANPGAYIDSESVMAHSDDDGEVAIIYSGDESGFNFLEHSAEKKEEEKSEPESPKESKKEEKKMDEEKTVEEVFEDIEKKLTPEEMNVVYAIIGQAAEGGLDEDDDDEEDDEEEGNMKHNVFDQDEVAGQDYLAHSDEVEIVNLAKKTGSFKDALNYYAEDNGFIAHGEQAVPVGGFSQDPQVPGNVSWMFPEYHDVNANRPPEMITDDWTWQEKVINKCHKLPFSRVRTNYVDIRHIDELRAKGYPRKGAYKTYSGNFTAARRTTDPQTVYVKNALHRDDIVDITDFNYVDYLYKIDQQMLKNEIATAILFGDGRSDESEDKIQEDKIRPIWTDDDLYTMKGVLDLAAAKAELNGSDTSKHFGDNYVLAEAFMMKILYMREKFKGSGTPDLYCTPHMLNVMLFARDLNGRRIYSSIEEIRSALNVNSIITIEQMEDKQRVDATTGKKYKLDAILVNLQDYAIGSTKGGQISHFTQFDIDFNQEKSLIETRLSGALTKVWSAIVIEEEVKSSQGNS